MRLTEDVLRKVKRPTSGQVLLWDDLLQGFGVRLTPTRCAYVVQWRETDGRRPREGLRRFWPGTPIAEARELARARLGEVLTPAEGNAGLPLRVAMRQWFERQGEIADWRPRYRTKVDGLIRHYIEGEVSERINLTPALRAAVLEVGAKPVGSVTRSDVLRLADGIKRGAADQLLAVLSSFYNYMFDRGVEIVNPARNRLRIFGGRRTRTRALSEAEFLTLWRALEGEGDPALGAFATLAYTGVRRREATQMRWSEVDLKRATWTLPPERRKTGKRDPEPFVIHLHPAMLAILKRQPVLKNSPFVFWGRRDKRPFEFNHSLMLRLKALGLAEWRLHDLRRMVRSGLGRLGVTQTVAEMCLGHLAKSGLVAVYDQHSYASEKRAAWALWGDHLSSLIAARARKAKRET